MAGLRHTQKAPAALDAKLEALTAKPHSPSLREIGSEIVLVSEDFAKFTAGSEDDPDGTELSDWNDGTIDAKYTQQPGWRGGFVYQAGVTKQTRERAKKASLNNKKLRDCRVHYCDAKGDRRDDTSLFITEGLSATGTITKVRNVETQAVFSLRGKPLNTFGKSQKDIKANEEFYLLDAALDIADGIENLRYNKVIIATDADVDGMHIRLLMITYFLQFYPDLVKKGHVYILQTPLFRVRNKNTSRGKKKVKDEIYYCYTDDERVTAINRLGKNAEITRFKGLGEISADEFKDFIGPDMRLDQVKLRKEDSVKEMLEFYMGKNTMERQLFIVDNLVVEDNDNMDMTH